TCKFWNCEVAMQMASMGVECLILPVRDIERGGQLWRWHNQQAASSTSRRQGLALGMITLYQIHWSHYVEKVRWALDYKGIKWSAVEIDPFTKHQMRHLPPQTTLDTGHQAYAVPMIHDEMTGSVLGESSRILDYLERTYPTPALYPTDLRERNEVARW